MRRSATNFHPSCPSTWGVSGQVYSKVCHPSSKTRLVLIIQGGCQAQVPHHRHIFEPCLSGLLPMRHSDAKFRPWIPVVSRRRFRNFSGYSPMIRHAQDTLNTCGGRKDLRVPSAETLGSRTVLPNEGRSYCGAARAIPISHSRLAPSCNRAIRHCLHGSGRLTW
jgi:hypothetical protein